MLVTVDYNGEHDEYDDVDTDRVVTTFRFLWPERSNGRERIRLSRIIPAFNMSCESIFLADRHHGFWICKCSVPCSCRSCNPLPDSVDLSLSVPVALSHHMSLLVTYPGGKVRIRLNRGCETVGIWMLDARLRNRREQEWMGHPIMESARYLSGWGSLYGEQ